MKKIRNAPKHLNNTQYDFAYTKTGGQKLDKSFWQRMSGKAKLSLIATIAAVTIATPTLSNVIHDYNYPDISGYEISMENIENNDTLDYWLNEYNNTEDNGAKKYIMTQIANYKYQIEREALNNVKDIIVEQMKENPNEKDYFYNKIEDSSDIKIHYSVDSHAQETFSITGNNDVALNVRISESMKDVIRSVGDLQELEKSDNKEKIGQQALRVLKQTNKLKEYEYSAENKKKGFLNKKLELKIDENKIDTERDDI